MMLESKF